MGFFACVSRRPGADLKAPQKRDSKAGFWPAKVPIFTSGDRLARPKWQTAGELLERGRQQFGIFAGAAILAPRGLYVSADFLCVLRAILDWPMFSSASTKYRPDIDGLRAIAVMLVVNFHAFPEAMPGGFIGVDIFFVISGFLITGIIVRELDQQRFSLLAFYNRRIRRIFPALIVVLGATLVLGWLWMLPAAYAQLSADVFASAAFFSNIVLLLQSGYFDIESARKPLLHLWSLGIEEQFYLFWPLILMLVARLRLSILVAASVIGIGSFVLNAALIGSNPIATFYLPFARAWELLAGAALACSWNEVSQTFAASNRRGSIGLVVIAAVARVLDTKSAVPGWWAVFPVAGAALLLSAPAAWFCRTLLASRPLVWIGLIGYPLYLWHWPLLVFFGIIKFGPLTLVECELILGLRALLGWLTYRAFGCSS